MILVERVFLLEEEGGIPLTTVRDSGAASCLREKGTGFLGGLTKEFGRRKEGD